MKKLISLVASIGIGSVASIGALSVQSCNFLGIGQTRDVESGSYTDESYKEYVKIDNSSSNDANDFKFLGSTTTGNSASWSLSSPSAKQELEVQKTTFVSAEFKSSKLNSSNTDTIDVTTKDGDNSITNSNEIVRFNKNDSIVIKNNQVTSGTLNLNYYSSKDKTSLEYTLSIFISNKCYKEFLKDANKVNVKYDDNSNPTEDTVNISSDFVPVSSTQGYIKSSEGFSAGSDYAYIDLTDNVSSIDIKLDNEDLVDQYIYVGNSSDVVTNDYTNDSDSINQNSNGDSAYKITSSNDGITINFDDSGTNKLSLDENNRIYIGYTSKQQISRNFSIDNLVADITLNAINPESQEKDQYNLNVNFSGKVNGNAFMDVQNSYYGTDSSKILTANYAKFKAVSSNKGIVELRVKSVNGNFDSSAWLKINNIPDEYKGLTVTSLSCGTSSSVDKKLNNEDYFEVKPNNYSSWVAVFFTSDSGNKYELDVTFNNY